MKKLKNENKVHYGRNENRFDNHKSQGEKYLQRGKSYKRSRADSKDKKKSPEQPLPPRDEDRVH